MPLDVLLWRFLKFEALELKLYSGNLIDFHSKTEKLSKEWHQKHMWPSI